MLIGFIGDVHGRVFVAVAAVATWQRKAGRRFDVLVQVGDMGAFPDPERADPATAAYLSIDPSEADFARLMRAEGALAAHAQRVRAEFSTAIHFLRGNHEDFGWLSRLPVETGSRTAAVDRFDLLRYVPDGAVLTMGGLRFAFLGGVEEQGDDAGIHRGAYERLTALEAEAVDVLVTHEGPYGNSIGFNGDVHGSRLIGALVERMQPRFHIAGHAHQLVGPVRHGATTYLGLDGLVASRRWHPEARGLQPGCLAVLDTEAEKLSVVSDDWLTAFPTPFDFETWCDESGGTATQ
ncbi:MAG: metallophosphoesterase [Dehalococcoidia bacterium]